MRLAFLIPAPDFREEWRWAFDVEAEALAERGFAIDPIPWTEASDFSGYDLIVPLLVWGYFERYEEWLALLDRFVRADGSTIGTIVNWASHPELVNPRSTTDPGIPASMRRLSTRERAGTRPTRWDDRGEGYSHSIVAGGLDVMS